MKIIMTIEAGSHLNDEVCEPQKGVVRLRDWCYFCIPFFSITDSGVEDKGVELQWYR
jgi:hypothetical protein